MSSCCGGNCSCGADCKCGTGSKDCKMYPDVSYAEETTTSKIPITDTPPQKSNFEGSEVGVGAESIENGCKCNPCNCNPCNCK